MNLMIDLETWGTTEQAVIRAAALVIFDDYGEKLVKRVIDARTSVDRQLECGRSIDADTVAWWSKQKPLSWMIEADELKQIVKTVSTEMKLITAFRSIYEGAILTSTDEKVFVWSRGRFDMQIISNLFAEQGQSETPWRYWQERDVRTLDSFVPQVKSKTPHNPLEDCYAQVAQVAAMYQLKGT